MLNCLDTIDFNIGFVYYAAYDTIISDSNLSWNCKKDYVVSNLNY